MTEGRPLVAASYDGWFDAPWGSYAFAVERRALLGALGPVAGLEVLDVGCGTGRFTAALEAAGAHVTGVDHDAGMLGIAATRVGGPLIETDAHELPFPGSSFDLVTAVTLLEFAERAGRVIDELFRVTRPGGRVAVAVLNPRSPWGVVHRRQLREPPWTEACLRTPGELRALVAGRGRLRVHGALHSPAAFPGLRAVGPLIERAGLLCPRLGAFQIAVVEVSAPQPGVSPGRRRQVPAGELESRVVSSLGALTPRRRHPDQPADEECQVQTQQDDPDHQ